MLYRSLKGAGHTFVFAGVVIGLIGLAAKILLPLNIDENIKILIIAAVAVFGMPVTAWLHLAYDKGMQEEEKRKKQKEEQQE